MFHHYFVKTDLPIKNEQVLLSTLNTPPTAARDAPAHHPSSHDVHDVSLTVCELFFNSELLYTLNGLSELLLRLYKESQTPIPPNQNGTTVKGVRMRRENVLGK